MTTYQTEPETRALRRCPHDRMVAGVAAGIAEHLELDVTYVRVGMGLLLLFGGIAVPLYLAAWLLIPEEGSDRSIGDELAERIGLD